MSFTIADYALIHGLSVLAFRPLCGEPHRAPLIGAMQDLMPLVTARDPRLRDLTWLLSRFEGAEGQALRHAEADAQRVMRDFHLLRFGDAQHAALARGRG